MTAHAAIQAEGRFPTHLAADSGFHEFLATTARYLLTPSDLLALGRLGERELGEIGLSAADFDDMLAALWRTHEK
jgi:hypothetical protein